MRSCIIGFTIVLLAGCGVRGSKVPGAALPVVSRYSVGKTARAAFTIRWPVRRVEVALAGRKPDYISPSTMALIVEVNPNAKPAGAVLIANNPGTGSTSTVEIDAPAGKDQFVFSLWDKPQKQGEGAPVGNELGQTDLPNRKIVAGRLNTLEVTIDGIVRSVLAAPLPNQPFLETNASGGGYELVGSVPETFAVTTYDADGNVIVSPGAPKVSLAPSKGTEKYLLVSPISGKPGEFTIEARSAASSTTLLTVTPSAKNASGSTATGPPILLNMLSAVYVSYAIAPASQSKVIVYDSNGTPIPLPDVFAGLSDPVAVTYDAPDRRVYVADQGNNTIAAFDAQGNPIEGSQFAPPTLAGINGLVYDPNTATLFATGSTSIAEFSRNGTPIDLVPGSFGHTAYPLGIAFVAAEPGVTGAPQTNELLVGNQATFGLDLYQEDGTHVQSIPIDGAAPVGPIHAVAAVNAVTTTPLWLTMGGASPSGFFVGNSQLDGSAQNPKQTSATSTYWGCATDYTAGPAGLGELFVVESDANLVEGFDSNALTAPSGLVITTPASSGLAQPQGIAIAY